MRPLASPVLACFVATAVAVVLGGCASPPPFYAAAASESLVNVYGPEASTETPTAPAQANAQEAPAATQTPPPADKGWPIRISIASVVVFDVLKRQFDSNLNRGDIGLLAAFGPGFTAEMAVGEWTA